MFGQKPEEIGRLPHAGRGQRGSDGSALGGPEGVKLEEPALIADDGPQVLSALPLDADDI